MIYTTGTIAINGNTVTGTGTNFSAPLSLIRVGCTLIAIGNPVQIFTITEIKNGTELSVTPAANPAIPAGTKFSILLSDSISVDGLAQDVAETLRYYQGKETEIASAIEFFQNFDEEGLTSLVNQATSAATQTTADKAATAQYKSEAEAAKNAAQTANTSAQAAKNAAQTAKADAEAAKNAAQTAASSISIPLPVSSGGTGARDAATARKNLGLGDNSTPQFTDVLLKKTSESTAGWVAGGVLSSALVDASGSERVRGSLYSEAKLSSPAQLTMRLSSDGVNKYAIFNANGEFITDSLKPKNPEQTRRNINIPTIGGGELITINAPSGVEDGKYYPIIVNSSYYGAYETGYQIDIHTRSDKSGDPMNCNAFTGYVRTGGWSDRKDSGYGYCTIHSANEIALQSICAPGKYPEHLLFVFVEARAFPVTMRLPVGVTATAPDSQVIYNEGKPSEMIVPWGVSDSISSFKNLIVMFDFRLGRSGFYSATPEGLYYICSGGRVGLFNGINLNEEVRLTMPKLTINGMVKSSDNYVVNEISGRFIRHAAYSSTTANAHVVTWGSSAEPLNYEVKAVGTDSSETTLKTLFTAKYLSDGSATLAVEGNITCTSVTQSSDRDLKDNIQVIGDATEAIRKMNGYTYTLKENGLPYAGVIAQEVMEALPEAVGSFTHYGEALQGPTIDGNELREETRYLNVDYAAVTGLLVQVARETDNRVTELEEENASLRLTISAMDERIAKLEALVSKLTGSEK